MTAFVTDLSGDFRHACAARIEGFLRTTTFDRPTLVIDTEVVLQNFRALSQGLGDAHIHYAVKANPEPEVIEALVNAGSHFDAASRGEIELRPAVPDEQSPLSSLVERRSLEDFPSNP